MPNFNKDTANRGNEVIERGSGGGTFKPWLRQFFWKEADDSYFVLILNQLEDIMRLEYHPFVDTDDGPRSVIARTDPGIGERVDPLEQQWGYTPRTTDLMIAVELEPVWETRTVNGRDRDFVSGFAVKTKTIERRIRNEDGELTDEKEELEIPEIGFIAQSPFNFGNILNSYENNDGPIHLTPFKITQVGAGSGKSFTFSDYPDATIDLTNLLEYIENVSYVKDPEELLDSVADLDQVDAGLVIGQYLLDLKLEELSDPEYYDEVFKATSKPSRYQKEAKEKPASKSSRPQRAPQRRTTAPVEDAPAAEAAEVTEEKTTTARGRATSGKSQPSAKEKLAELRAAKAAKDAAKVAA